MTAQSLAPVAEKLSKIIPRLGSGHDGEIIASAKAIERTLRCAGLSWHDLAAAIAESQPRAQYRDWRRSDEEAAPLWNELVPAFAGA